MAEREAGFVVAVAGATGAVGGVLLRVLEERNFPVRELRPLASERSAGSTVSFRNVDIEVEVARPESFENADFVFFAATGSLSKTLAPEVVKRGGIAIDKSSTWRMHDDVPLVVPEVNGDALEGHKGLIACPNCTTIGFVMALEPLRRRAGLERVVVTTLQAVSGAGRPGLEELERQQAAIREGRQAPDPETFVAQIADNVVPLCDVLGDDGYSGEETKLLHETRKILSLPDLPVSTTCVRVPVPIGHSASILVHTERALSVAEAEAALAAFPGVEVVAENGRVPTPIDVVGRDQVLVGRVRKDLHSEGLWLFQVSDNLRKGAATNAVQIAEEILRRKLLH